MSRLFTMVSFVVVLAACTRANVDNEFAPARQPFPEFRLDAIDGTNFDSRSLQGKVVLINFWASWCGPCRIETPSLVELKREYADKGFEVLGIAIDPENRDEIHKFVQDFDVNYPVLYSDRKIEREAALLGTPTSFLLDRDGFIVHKHTGVVAKETLAAEIETLVNRNLVD